MKIKKHIILTLVICSLIINITGCSSKELDVYTSIISDSANDELNIKSECNFWTGEYFNKKDVPEQSCVVYGKSYTGVYSKSIIDKLNSYTTDIYVDENNIEFGLRSDNNELAYINLMNARFFDTEPFLEDVDDPQDTAVTLAKEIAGDYVDDINDYTQILEEPTTRHKEKDGKTYDITYYVITFARKIKEYYTSDYIAIKVTSKGNLASIMMGDINAFSDIEMDFDIDRLNQSIKNKVDVTYNKTKLNIKESNIQDQKIVLAPNGDVCMYSNIEIVGYDGTNTDITTGVSILTVLDKRTK